MSFLPVLGGGLAAGLLIVAGEALLNLALLGKAWAEIFSRFGLPEPGPLVAAQGVLKLTLLGVLSVWLAISFQPVRAHRLPPGIASGLLIWLLVWAWVQWGMFLAGFVPASVAIATIAWGFVELPLAARVGVWLHGHLAKRISSVRQS